MAKQSVEEPAEQAPAPSLSQHMEAMFSRFMRAGAGRALRMGDVGMSELYAVFCAGFSEGIWTERGARGARKERGDGR